MLLSENGIKSKIFHVSGRCSTFNLSRTSQCFRCCKKCSHMKNRGGIFAEWAAFAVEDVPEFALLCTGASRTVGGNMMVNMWSTACSTSKLQRGCQPTPQSICTFAGIESREQTPNIFGARGSERRDSDLVWTQHDPRVWSRYRWLTLALLQLSSFTVESRWR